MHSADTDPSAPASAEPSALRALIAALVLGWPLPAAARECRTAVPVLMDGFELRVPDRGALPRGECDLLVTTTAEGAVSAVALLDCPAPLVEAASDLLRAQKWRPARACRQEVAAETGVAVYFGEPGSVRNITEVVRVREQFVPELPPEAILPEGQYLSCDLRIYADRKGIARASTLVGCSRVRPVGGDQLEVLPEPLDPALLARLGPLLSQAGVRWRFYPGLSDMSALPSPFDLTLVFTPLRGPAG
jgi:hypothetical protein